MKEYRLKITSRALADMEAVYQYIAEVLQAPETAMRQYNRIAEEIESLRTFPERYQLFIAQPEHDLGMRRLLVGNYSVIYVVNDADVTVLRVLYSSLDLHARLQNSR